MCWRNRAAFTLLDQRVIIQQHTTPSPHTMLPPSRWDKNTLKYVKTEVKTTQCSHYVLIIRDGYNAIEIERINRFVNMYDWSRPHQKELQRIKRVRQAVPRFSQQLHTTITETHNYIEIKENNFTRNVENGPPTHNIHNNKLVWLKRFHDWWTSIKGKCVKTVTAHHFHKLMTTTIKYTNTSQS